MKKIFSYIKYILVPVAVGGVVGIIISEHIDYDSLVKPALAPPSIVFPIAWTILYILMGISYGILGNNGLIDKKSKLIYYLQLGTNALWSIIFFVFKWRLFAAIWIGLLVIQICIMIINFYSKNKLSGMLQIPYLLWCLFALYLNISIYVLNG